MDATLDDGSKSALELQPRDTAVFNPEFSGKDVRAFTLFIVHKEHMVRKMLSSNVRGDSLSEVAAETEADKTYTFTVEDDWNVENLTVAVLILDDKGHVNNMATCAVDGGNMDYEYIN